MAFGRECLQSKVVVLGDDDSALVGDANSFSIAKLAWLEALRAELEQERAIDRRQYLHSIVVSIADDDSMSIIIDRNACRNENSPGWLPHVPTENKNERSIDDKNTNRWLLESRTTTRP